ncbi:MAG TPA: hypothetical protein VK177_07220 [Flavobacteriales bacterium]|nr:hypothetical protein [Flavobacteriales bacterium]
MKFFKLLLLVALLHSLAFAQGPIPQGPFVKLTNDSLLYGSNLSFEPHFFSSSKITLDGRVIHSRDVNMFCDNSGNFYARLMGQGLQPSVHSDGDIHVYRVIKTSATTMGRGWTSSPGGGMRFNQGTTTYSTNTLYFYSLGLQNAKKLNFRNLKLDFSHDVVVAASIKKGRAMMVGSFLTGAGCLGFGLLAIKASSSDRDMMVPYIAGAVTCCIISTIFYFQENKMLKTAARRALNYDF